MKPLETESSHTAPIHAISRHRINVDGKGINTLVTFYECPLRCKYCLNQDTWGDGPADSYCTPTELYERVKIDRLYFLVSGGGVTFGGGEPCLRPDFISEFRGICGSQWKIRVETSLHVPQTNIQQLIPIVDQWMVDVKAWDGVDKYRMYTGGDVRPLEDNLDLLAKHKIQDKVKIRIPCVAGYANAENQERTMCDMKRKGYTDFDLFTYKIPKQ